jgi:transcriptional regulator with XRE-family HTH domain
MARQNPFDGTQQAAGLRSFLVRTGREFRSRSGRTLTDMAGDLGMAYGTLWKYIDGRTPLGFEQTAEFARVFETTEPELLRACFASLAAVAPADATSRTYDARAEMRSRNVPEDRIAEEWESIYDWPEADQRAHVDAVAEEFNQEERGDDGASPRQQKRDRRVG